MSFWLNTKRVARYGLAGFVRNGFVSLAAIVIVTITLFVFATLLISSAALASTLDSLTQKVDVTVYFTTTATDQEIADVQASLVALPQVASTTFVSRDEALAAFRERHATDQLTIQALDELGENPLGASIEVRAKDTSQYASIAKFLEDQQSDAGSASPIEKVNFTQNKAAIDRLTTIIDSSRRLGIAIAILLGLASVLITFNTIRLAIYTSREEIGVMNLVGAGHWYVRGPFMIAGVLYGLVSAVVVLLLLYPLTAWLGPASERFLGTFNVFTYFTGSFAVIFLSLMGAGIALGALSSYLAVRRYLKI
ncbi:MAG TPA: permease-like cell division protein FtsX [Candidatus Paceibacterota bacterium]|nr:permease-like cell division protein FtsX [Candidatus Paceibacterota bacterium]